MNYKITQSQLHRAVLLGLVLLGTIVLHTPVSAQQGPCILGPEENVGGQDGFSDQAGGTACIARNYIEPPSGGLGDHQSGSFYGACYGLGEGDWSTVGGCISRVNTYNPPSTRCDVYGHYCAQGAGAGSCGPIGYDVTSFPEYNDRIQQCRDLGYTQEMFNTIEEQGDIGNAMRSTGCLVNWERDAGFGQAHYEKPSCVAPPTGGSCTVTNIEYSGETYPRDCYSEDQGGNIGLPVCQENYTSEGDVVTNQTDISNGRCIPARDLPIPDGGTCTRTDVIISCDGAAPTSCTPDGSLYLWNGINWDDYNQPDDWLTTIGVGISQPPSIDWTTNRDRGNGVRFYGSGDPDDSGNRLQCEATDDAVCGDQSEFWGGGFNPGDCSPMYVTCGPNQMIEYDTEETERQCPGFPGRSHIGYIGRCVPDVSCQAGNMPPNQPDITGPNSGSVNLPYDFNIQGTDPEQNNLRYGLTDASCSEPYQWLPSTGRVPNNTMVTLEDKIFATPGSYTLYVLSEDESGARSTCAQHSIEITPTPAATADLKINGSDGPIDVPRNTTATLSWTSANAASCTMFGEGMGPAGMSVPLNSTGMPVSITQTGNFAVLCGDAPDSVTANVVNRPPEQPTISHDTGRAPFNTLTTFRIQGNDPDGDNVFYEVDWNTSDADGFNTTTGGGVNNSIQTASRAFTTSGPQTVRARTVDVPAGLRSPWGTYVITIENAPAPTATLEAAINGGSFSSDDQTVNPGDTITMRWGSTNATTCTGSGSGFNTNGDRSGFDPVDTPAANTATTFTAMCTGDGGSGSESLTITTRQLPNFNQPNITYQLSNGFDLATGYYDSVTVTFNTTNNGGSDTRSSADYQFQYDNNRDGYEYTRTGGLGLLTVNQTVNRTETVPGPILFGNARVRVAVDHTNQVAETDEGDNVRALDLALPPPDPGLDITADKPRLRQGETTTIRWSTRATYPLQCKVFGPNLTVDPSNFSGSRPTAPITAKSLYTFTCTEPITGTVFSDSVTVETEGTVEEI